MTEPADLAAVAARFGAVLHDSGVAVGPDRSERFARAVLLTRPETTRALYWCAAVTLLADPADRPAFDRAFDLVFGGLVDDASTRGGPPSPGPSGVPPRSGRAGGGQPGVGDRPPGAPPSAPGTRSPYPVIATASERLGGRDFAKLSPDELLALAVAMRRLKLASPPRRTRRTQVGRRGPAVDLRATLRAARRTGGHPVRLRRRRPRVKPRRLVVLCDISGSMAPYARALLQLVYCAAGGERAEVFTFATRLTRLTHVLRRVSPAVALDRAGRAAPDWSGGTRIGAALRTFLDEHGARGMARGAVVLILSDGWDTGPPEVLGEQMARLSRLAHRVVWANPRTQSAEFRPLTAGMAAAWPHCDAVVSAHRLDALDDLLVALADPGRRRRPAGGGGPDRP
ncbi:VWA domain-containing protein [Asanoa sp. WMMD1127]|uniref:vWA domain-containing protein n=1 Tax=Asanoa sp. WMMD1127 TaxID=3016107 RepID=UPI0024180F8B|nr:VWA domain-containing protein [Asanoa sp. WMMD1127]MDG4824201.1 VWA domain-containing protein [Asanoa sp. WMMD1127]